MADTLSQKVANQLYNSYCKRLKVSFRMGFRLAYQNLIYFLIVGFKKKEQTNQGLFSILLVCYVQQLLRYT